MTMKLMMIMIHMGKSIALRWIHLRNTLREYHGYSACAL